MQGRRKLEYILARNVDEPIFESHFKRSILKLPIITQPCFHVRAFLAHHGGIHH